MLSFDFMATVEQMMFFEVVGDSIGSALTSHPPSCSTCVRKSVHKTRQTCQLRHCISLPPMKDLRRTGRVWLQVRPRRLYVCCLVCTCHVEMKIHVCSQAWSDKAHLHCTIMHDDSEPFFKLFSIYMEYFGRWMPMSCSVSHAWESCCTLFSDLHIDINIIAKYNL